MKPARLVFSLILFSVLFASCRKDPEMNDEPEEEIRLVIPEGFPAPVYNFDHNPLTKNGFELGRKLFYDPLLSKDNSISCGSCHQQFAAFSHLEHAVSHGINGKLGTRNAPGMFNLIWQPNLMWDGGVHSLETQPLSPITNPVEMDETLEGVLTKLRTHPLYPGLFKKAFDTDSITTAHMFKAMAQFMGMLNSSESRFDHFKRQQESFSQQEEEGLQLFRTRCESCHKEPFFTDFSFRNNGLDTVFADSGRAMISFLQEDIGKFKVPSLRNIALTFPYMHDGRFETLEQVIGHYRSGVKMSPSLDSSLFSGIPMTDDEQEKIIAFLKTLTDSDFVSDKRFSKPPK